MKDKKVFVYLFMVFIFALALFMLFRTNTQSFKRLNAAVSPEEEKNLIIEKAKQYIADNIEKFDGESEILLKDLIVNNYLTDEETMEVTKDLYDENTRIFFNVSKSKIDDIYLKDELFSKLFRCVDVCYINNDNNYIYYNNDVYRILKSDSEGNVYIINEEVKQVNPNDMNQTIRNKYNEIDRKLSGAIDVISKNDINESSFIKPERDMLVSSPRGYMIYDIISKDTREIDVDKTDAMFVIKLLNTINYKMGDGTKFNPYVVGE